MKLLEIIISFIICLCIVITYILYLQCALGEHKKTENWYILQIKKIKIKPTKATLDSYKYLKFWLIYYKIKYGL